MNQTFKERVLILLSALGLTQRGLARAIDIRPALVSDILHDRSQSFSQSTMNKLSEKFDINLNWLVKGVGPMFLTEGSFSHTIPIVGTISAGTPALAWYNGENYLTIPSDFFQGKAIQVQGTAMEEFGLFHGDVMLVENVEFQSGEILAYFERNVENPPVQFAVGYRIGAGFEMKTGRGSTLYDETDVEIIGRVKGLLRLY